MFSGKIRQLASTTAFRLTAWYSAIFIISSSLIFLLALYMLSRTVTRQDRAQVSLKLREYLSVAHDAGIDGLMEEISREKEYYRAAGYFVRLLDSSGHTLFCFIPRRFKDVDCMAIPVSPARPEDPYIVIRRHEDRDVLEIQSAGLPAGYEIQVGKSSTTRLVLMEKFYQVFFMILLLTAATGLVSGAFLSFKALAPLRDLIGTVRSITGGDMEARVPVRHHEDRDELDTLARLFNRMLERIQELVRGMKESLDYAAHDLRTPVARLKAVVESTLQKDCGRTGLENALMDCAEEADRISVMLTTLMDISEAEAGVMRLDLRRQPVRPVILDAVELYEYVAEEKDFSLVVDIPDGLAAALDRNRFRQAAANIIDNAIKYGNRGGRLEITGRAKDSAAALSFRDDGAGILPQDLPRIFDRLFRGDKSRSQKGLGLGLSLVKAVMEGHGFSIEVQSTPGRGTEIRIVMPV